MLNSLYGKFGTKINRPSGYIVNEDEEFHDKGEIVMKEPETSKISKYLPIAIAITSYAMMKLVDAIDNDYCGFSYCDTDSLFVDE
jgi:hypothetical protein